MPKDLDFRTPTVPGPETRANNPMFEGSGVIVEMNHKRYHFYCRKNVTLESETEMMQHALTVYDMRIQKFLKHRRYADKDKANRMLEICRDLGIEKVREICKLFYTVENPGGLPVGIEDYI